MLEDRETYEIIDATAVGQEAAQIVLGKHSGRHAFADTLAKMGLHVQGDALNQAFTRFKELADRKVEITEADLEAIVAEELGIGAVHRYSMVSLDVHGGTRSTPTANVVLLDGDRKVDAEAEGNGMIDAAINAIAVGDRRLGHVARLQGVVGDRGRRRVGRRRGAAPGRRPHRLGPRRVDRRRRGVRTRLPERGQQDRAACATRRRVSERSVRERGSRANGRGAGIPDRRERDRGWDQPLDRPEARGATTSSGARDIPHRDEGYDVLLEYLPPTVATRARPRDRRRLPDGDHPPGARRQVTRRGRVDFSPEMLARAGERFAGVDAVEVVEHDLDAPLPDTWGSFDAVVSAFAIHHVVDDRKQALYAEVFERLSPGGVFLNLEHVASPTPELHEAFLDAIGYGIDGDDPSNKLVAVETQLGWLRGDRLRARRLPLEVAGARHCSRGQADGVAAPPSVAPMQEGGRPRTRELALSLGALGVVYGDIGTNPLFAIREAFEGPHHVGISEANILGLLSLIFWSLVLVITIKYINFVMRASNDGEGGILALGALVTPERPPLRGGKWVLVLLGLFGAGLLYGDGIITPAISVLAAVEGTAVATPDLEQYVVPIAIVILVALFLVQRRGTASIGKVFGPVMVVWFAVIGVLGAAQVIEHPEVFEALDPSHAIDFFTRNGLTGFLVLGAVILVVVGGEALYADMGHFGRRPIALGWYGVVLPSLILVYFGQGALLMHEPSAIENPFYRLAPDWALYPLVVLATAATVIASQALISGAYSLTHQAVQLGYSPRVNVRHTSESQRGQIYIGSVNWALMAACVALVVGFQESANLAAAYGLAVTATMVITSILFLVVVLERFRWPRWVAIPLCTLFLVVDLAFFVATLFKIPDGGWLPLVVGGVVFTVLSTWRRGRLLVNERLLGRGLPITRFVENLDGGQHTRAPGTSAYLFRTPGMTPPALLANLRLNNSLHELVLVVSIVTEERPRVHPSQRAEVTDLGGGFQQVVLRYGFMDEPDVPRAGRPCHADRGLRRADDRLLHRPRDAAGDRPSRHGTVA